MKFKNLMQRLNSTKPSPWISRYLARWLFLFAALLALAAYLAYSQYRNYLDIGSQQRDQLARQALLVERNLVPQLGSVKRALDSVLQDLPSWKSEPSGLMHASRRLKAIAQILPGEDRLVVTDAQGKVIASNQQEVIGLDLSQRDYFQLALKQNDSRITYLTPPFTTDRGKISMDLARVVAGPHNAFDGLVIAGFSDTIFNTLLDSVRDANDVVSYIAHSDGIVFTTMPEMLNIEGKSLAVPGSLFSRHRNSGKTANILEGFANISQTQRLVAFRTIDLAGLGIDKPLVIAVSRDRDAIFSHWNNESIGAVILLGLFGMASSLGLLFYQRRHRVIGSKERLQQQMLQASQSRLRTIIESAPECVKIVDAQGRLKDMNAFGLTLIDASSKAQVLDMAISNFVVPEHREAYREMHQRVLAGATVELEFDLLSRTGQRRHMKTHSVPMQFDEQTVQLSFTQDITQKKQAETDLRVAATAFESQEGMMITNADSVILRVNQAFTEITGYTADEVVGQKPSKFRSDRHDPSFYKEMWLAIDDTGKWQGEIWDKRKSGEEYLKWLTISAVKDGNDAVTHYVGTLSDLTERKRAQEKILELGFFDQLTRLPNRTLLLDRLRQAMNISHRNATFGALLFIDLDQFKTINDTHGHDRGDLLLQQVAQRLSETVREGDTVARFGGDEFLIVLGSLKPTAEHAAIQTKKVANKILAALSQVYRLADIDHRCTASIGATLFSGHETAIEDLLKQADLAMYKSKSSGRNALRFFDPVMQIAVMEKAALEGDLRRAVELNQFVLHYQAQVTSAGRVTGCEALVRWQHPLRGMVSPADFIALAEENGLILPLGHWVLETACAQLARWAMQPEMCDLTVAVNVSAHQFRQDDFVAQVLAVLEATGANPKRLKLELTESLLIDDVQGIIEKMLALKASGVGFALDDFGTGYSSLAYLKRLPLNELKIDQSFVRDILIDANDAAIAGTIVALARSLGLGVIAEGVETEAQRDFLVSQGCLAYQGYFFSRPLPIQGFEALARRVSDLVGERGCSETIL